MSAVSDFVARFLPQAQTASAQTGLPVDYILGQAGLESAWGTSYSATTRNNLFGISPGGVQASYASPNASFSAYTDLMNSPRYAGANSPGLISQGAQAIGDFINGKGYSTTPDYGSRVAGATSAVDNALAGLGVSGGVMSGSGATTAGGGATDAAAGDCGLSPVCWLKALGSLASRFALVLLALVLLAGAVYLFASRTQLVSSNP